MIDRLDIYYTPQHGSWLDIAETELSILTNQCLDRRISDHPTLIREVAAWENQRNESNSTVDWQFTIENARIQLKRLHPSIQPC